MKTAIAHHGGRRYRYGAALLALLGGSLPSACTLDSSDRCSENQVFQESTLSCICDEHSAPTKTGCVRCGEHEVVSPAGCVCADGFSRASAGAACEETPDGFGIACDASTPCPEGKYNHCESSDFGSYCTNTGCTTSADCEGGYACDTATGVCRRPPVGLGMSCASNAECAGTEATYCDTVKAHACLVQGCTVAPDNCFEGWDCCDLSGFGVPQPICVPAGGCPK